MDQQNLMNIIDVTLSALEVTDHKINSLPIVLEMI